MRVFGRHQMGSANQDSEFQVRNLKSFHRGRPAICWLLPATSKSARRSLPAGSIGLCGGSYCRRPGSVGGCFSPTTFVILINQKWQLYPVSCLPRSRRTVRASPRSCPVHAGRSRFSSGEFRAARSSHHLSNLLCNPIVIAGHLNIW